MLPEPGTLAVSIAMAAAAGLVGSFAVMRRMALAADAVSHVALPGIGVAFAFHIHPMIGAASMLLAGAFLIWTIERRTGLATEAIVGVIFSAALAVGAMVTPGEELVDALLGRPGEMTPPELAFGFLASAAVIAFVVTQKDRLILQLLSPELARTMAIDVQRLELAYLVVFALTVALGLRYLGVLLMGSLIIVPAATAARLTASFSAMLRTAVVAAVASTVVGSSVAGALGQETGPVIVTVAAAFFFLSLLRRPKA